MADAESSENFGKKRDLPIRSKNVDMSSYLNSAKNENSNYLDQQQQSNKANVKSMQKRCSFCEKNGENAEIYLSHSLKDSLGKVVCPILRSYVCPKCGDSGDYAHTNKYCPETQRKHKENKIKKCFSASD
jgi:protein nanos 1